MAAVVVPLFIFLILCISKAYGTYACNASIQSCPNNEHCIAQTFKLQYPDIKNIGSLAVAKEHNYACNSAEYCKWGRMWDVNCVRIYVPDKVFPGAFYNAEAGICIVVEAAITINETFSCCHGTMDCAAIFTALEDEPKTESTYTTANCVHRPELTDIIVGTVDCYATEEFMKYIKCNVSDYADQCPLFFWHNLQTYAKCACVKLGQADANAYEYFKELTEMIEGMFAEFREKASEKCPQWIFSCNSEGDAELEVFEILCPLDMYQDTVTTQVKSEVDIGVASLTEDQVQIFGDYIRVLMYSEQEAYDAIEWLSLNVTDTTPIEIVGSRCTMNETKWNLNEIYGDYVPPTPAPTDSCLKISSSISLLIIVLIHSFLLY